MAWEHALLGDVSPARIAEAAAGDVGPVEEYSGLLAELGRAPRILNEGRLRARRPQLGPVRLAGSGLVVTLGELNVLPDYLGRPEEIEAWHAFHLAARDLIARSATAHGGTRDALRRISSWPGKVTRCERRPWAVD